MTNSDDAIYLDHNATSPPLPEVVAAVAQAQCEAFGNPGSRHRFGRRARLVLERGREVVARVLQADPDEVIFTSGGTESNNLAIHGLSRLLTGGTPRTARITPGAHPSLLEPAEHLVSHGWDLQTLPCDGDGQIAAACVAACESSGPGLWIVQSAHNETGVLLNAEAFRPVFAAGHPVHFDTVQGVGRIDVSFRDLPCHTLSFGAHKFHGPRGIGGLLARKGLRLAPLLLGGRQEQGHRAGTELVALVAGMTTALELYARDARGRQIHLAGCRDWLQHALCGATPQCVVMGGSTARLPNTLDIAFPGCDGEALLVALDLAGVACSQGTTCASGSSEPAPILLAMGVTPQLARSTIRFSVGATTTLAEIEAAAQRILQVVARLSAD